jgi:hypothetical protein
VLPEYPRPQMARPESTYQNLNGLWQFQPANPTDHPPFGHTLSENILVPFPVESCLSGIGETYKYLWYRLVFNRPSGFSSGKILIHFGAVDWQSSVWINQQFIGNHTGGYDHFSYDITNAISATNNELIVYVYDPSDDGYQPNGKQRISAINNPGGDTYTPSSGIWQTVWLENVPTEYISNIRIRADTTSLTITTFTSPDNTGPQHGVDRPGGDMPGMPLPMNTYSHWDCYSLCLNTSGCVSWAFDVPLCGSSNQPPVCWLKSTVTNAVQNDCRISGTHQTPSSGVKYTVYDGNTVVASGAGTPGVPTSIQIPNPKLWTPTSPFLYTITVTTQTDSVQSYFGMRSVSLGHYQHPTTPDTGPQVGIDRSGGDMPGSPFQLSSADPTLCWNKCKSTSGCVNWAYAIPNCNGGGYSQPMCWLKSSYQGTGPNACRVSGALGQPAYPARRPNLNGEFIFYAGWLDQSYWPDGQYTAPTEEALAFDLQAVKTFGFNSVRLHQKVNPDRWYWYADSLGIVLLQDMFQKYGGATAATIQPFIVELYRMIDQLYNHPSIVQWEVFNEGDCVGVFNATQVTQMVLDLDPSRLVDTNSGGPANNLYFANVNDIHTYPYPGDPKPSATQYAMIGEFGGVGAFVSGKEWVAGQCTTYLHVNTPADEAATYINMTNMISLDDVSVIIYTQITDVELECDGFLNYDRTNKFTTSEIQSVAAANQKLINSASELH